MKKALLSLNVLLVMFSVQAQFSLNFCEDVTADGMPANVSNSFLVGNNGSMLKVLFKSQKTFGSDEVDFKIYYIGTDGNEEEVVDLKQEVKPEWNYAWKEIVLFDPGAYIVKVHSKEGKYLTSANVNIIRRE